MKYRKKLFALLTMFLIVSLFFNMTVYAAEREEITDITVETVTVSEMLSMQITKMAAECGTDLTVSCVKPLSDFSGNRYFVVEFEPTGYLICHGEYGETLEYAEESPSPYLGMEGDLLYAGPTYYYSLKDEMFSNPIFGEEVSTNDTDYLAALSDASDELDSTISATAELYVDLGEDMSLTATDYTRLEGTTVSPNAAPTPTGIKHYVPTDIKGTKIKDLITEDQMGYMRGGVCGYIAAGLMLYWIDEVQGSDKCVNDFTYIRSDQNGFINNNLTRELRSYGAIDGSDALGITGESINSVLNEYQDKHGMSIDTLVLLLNSENYPLAHLKAFKKPVIVFSQISKDGTNYDNHAVFAYGYTTDDQTLVHYGHANYSEVVLDTSLFFIPSLIALRDFSADDISISDVSSSYWGYTAIQYCTRFCLLPLENGRFRPEDDATRLEFVVALYSLAGKPDPVSDTISARFIDAPSKQADLANFNAAQWAFENGILTGTSSNTLELDDSLTREQAAVFFFRYATYLGFNFSITSGPAYTTFDDYRTVSPFARSGVDWATKRYLLRGDRGLLYPKRNLSNAETAQLIYNLTIRASR